MPNARREQPAAQHEFVLGIAVAAGEGGAPPALVLRVETVREFASFGYALEVQVRQPTSAGPAVLEIGGISVPVMSAQQSGVAVGTAVMAVPADGEYLLEVHRRQRRAQVRFRVVDGQPAILAVDGDPFIRASEQPRP